jgi:hypothetical protein
MNRSQELSQTVNTQDWTTGRATSGHNASDLYLGGKGKKVKLSLFLIN